ncbi:Transmembrane Protein 94 [Manis pentadactyla]|nr:Transmembrane Protein 94 [Manis pentadactyla]
MLSNTVVENILYRGVYTTKYATSNHSYQKKIQWVNGAVILNLVSLPVVLFAQVIMTQTTVRSITVTTSRLAHLTFGLLYTCSYNFCSLTSLELSSVTHHS